MTDRPAREHYDAHVELFPPRGVARAAFALVRRTYRVSDGGRMHLDSPLPLALGAEGRGPFVERWGDVSFARRRTDVLVRGAAYAPGSGLATRRSIALSAGGRTKRIEVFGRRVIEDTRGRVRFSDPEPFAFVPVTYENAYGGIDPRITDSGDGAQRYPRNPVGKGYLIGSGPADGIELPNLEDPAHLLTPANLFVEDPRAWWKQPLPACFEPVSALAFPRSALAGEVLRFPPPDDEALEEIRRGALSRDWRAIVEALAHDVPPALFAQRGGHGQVFDALAPDTKLAVEGMHPSRERFEAVVPAPPRIELAIDGRRREVEPRLVSVLIEPSEERVSFTWSGVLTKLPRVLMPTLHAAIPLALHVDGEEAIDYVAPPTLRERIEAIIREVRAVQRRERVRDTIPPPPPPEVEPPRDDPMETVEKVDPPGAPPRLARLADVEAFEAPYEVPVGAHYKPPAAPRWTSDGEHTGRLALPEEARAAPLPKTLQIALPDEAAARPIAEEKTAVLAALQPKPLPLPEQPTKILTAATAPHPVERTQVLSEAQLRGSASEHSKPARRSMYDEATAVLSGTLISDEAMLLDEPDELVVEGTQVLMADDLVELDEDE